MRGWPAEEITLSDCATSVQHKTRRETQDNYSPSDSPHLASLVTDTDTTGSMSLNQKIQRGTVYIDIILPFPCNTHVSSLRRVGACEDL